MLIFLLIKRIDSKFLKQSAIKVKFHASCVIPYVHIYTLCLSRIVDTVRSRARTMSSKQKGGWMHQPVDHAISTVVFRTELRYRLLCFRDYASSSPFASIPRVQLCEICPSTTENSVTIITIRDLLTFGSPLYVYLCKNFFQNFTPLFAHNIDLLI